MIRAPPVPEETDLKINSRSTGIMVSFQGSVKLAERLLVAAGVW
jgi:hypothetical protein